MMLSKILSIVKEATVEFVMNLLPWKLKSELIRPLSVYSKDRPFDNRALRGSTI